MMAEETAGSAQEGAAVLEELLAAADAPAAADARLFTSAKARHALESIFRHKPYPTPAVCEKLAKQFGCLTPKQVQNWFQNRRQREKKLSALKAVNHTVTVGHPSSIGYVQQPMSQVPMQYVQPPMGYPSAPMWYGQFQPMSQMPGQMMQPQHMQPMAQMMSPPMPWQPQQHMQQAPVQMQQGPPQPHMQQMQTIYAQPAPQQHQQTQPIYQPQMHQQHEQKPNHYEPEHQQAAMKRENGVHEGGVSPFKAPVMASHAPIHSLGSLGPSRAWGE
jgi:hypothetical protein